MEVETAHAQGDSQLRYPLAVTLCLGLAYVLVFVAGLVGNSCVVMVVVRCPKMRSSTNLFIVNLACADLLVTVLCLPFTLVSNITSAWTMGWLVCKTVPYLQGVSVNASVNTLVAISVERCCAICFPLRWQLTKRTCRRVILLIWLLSLSVTLPWALFFNLQPLYDGSDLLMCLEIWPTKYSGNVYFIVANLLMCYLLPLSVITLCYLLIWRRVFLRKPPGIKQEKTDKMVKQSKVKVVKMLLAVIVLFSLSWLPLYAIFARIKLGGPIDSEAEEAVIYVSLPFAQWLGTSNSCINPILYAFFNSKFRAGFKGIVLSKSCCSPLHYAPSGSDLRTVSSKQSIFSFNNLKDISLKKFQTRKAKSCALLFEDNIICSRSNLSVLKPFSYPNLKFSVRSVSVDNIYSTAPGKKYTDTLL